jgi:hypothetical protein
MITPHDFEWCWHVTVADTQNNWRETQTRSQPAQKIESIIGVGCLCGPVPLINFQCRPFMSSATINEVQSLVPAG